MKRCFEEAYRLGAELAASPNVTGTERATKLRALDRYFELPQTEDEGAIHVLLGGVVATLEVEAAYPSNGDGDDA